MLLVLAGCGSMPPAERGVYEQKNISGDNWNRGWYLLVAESYERNLQDQRNLKAFFAEPTPEPYVEYVPRSIQSYDFWRELVSRYTDWDIDTMLRIISCESGGDAGAISPPDSDGIPNYGPFQAHGDPEAAQSIEYALENAHEKFKARGYQPWVGSMGCWR